MNALFCAVIGYLLGSVSPSALLSKIKKKNIREHGTKNLGALNTLINFGKGWGVFVMLFDIAKEKEIPHQASVSPPHTGTNAVSIQRSREGIPTVDVGLPLASMHTYNEIISLDDTKTLSDLIVAFITDEKIAAEYGKGGLEI